MKPRITINIDKDGQLEIWVNQAGRDLLVKELQTLSGENDRVLLQPEGMPDVVPTQGRAYRESDQVFDWVKILFRTDELDERFFPRVMDETKPRHTDADYYGSFMTGLFGLVDDAQLSGYSAEATALLHQARELFWREFHARHPHAWKPRHRLSDQGSG
jgi:hypothetical protein